MAPHYSDKMRCFVVGIPRISTMNGHGRIGISTAIAPDPETALRTYLSRESPLHAQEIIEYLVQRNATLSEFAIHAPSHDIANRGSYTPDQLARQNLEISEGLALVCDKDPEEVLGAINRLLG
jgi:hypothetical protein